MSKKKKTWIGLVVLLALNVTMLALNGRRRLWAEENVNARDMRSISDHSRLRAVFDKGEPIDLIGCLITNHYWTKILPLAKEQAGAITKLDDLVSEARVDSYLADAEYPGGDPDSYRRYLARSETRRHDAIRHARRLVTLGLLTEPQAAVVIQRLLSGRQGNALYDENVQELLGMTKSQKEKLAQVSEKAQHSEARLNLMTVNPEEQKQNAAKLDAIKQEHASEAKGILTPSQLDTWSRLTAERSLPAQPPNLSPSDLSDAEAARIKIPDLSPTFRALAEKADALGLSADQKKFLKDLEEVTRDGLLWISLKNPEGVSQTRAEFVKHAEQVALLGILTERQAEQIEAAIKKN